MVQMGGAERMFRRGPGEGGVGQQEGAETLRAVLTVDVHEGLGAADRSLARQV